MEKTATRSKLIENGILRPYKVLFVCTGNTCRSPMAEVVFNDLAKKTNNNSVAYSAGLFATGADISAHSKTVLIENGLADENYTRKSVMITSELCAEADLIVGMTEGHARTLIMSFPMYATKIKALDKEIGDPFGGYLETYRECFKQIYEAVKTEFFPDYHE